MSALFRWPCSISIQVCHCWCPPFPLANHWWCPPFSTCHVAFLFICLPGLSLLVSALFRWPCLLLLAFLSPFLLVIVSVLSPCLLCLRSCLASCGSLCRSCLPSFAFVFLLVSLLVDHCVCLSPFCYLLSPFLSPLLVIVSALSSLLSPFVSGLVSLLVDHRVRLVSLLFPFVALDEVISCCYKHLRGIAFCFPSCRSLCPSCLHFHER